MTPAELLTGLDDRFQLLSGGRRRQRQRTLEATLDWSYDLLDTEEQRVLRALGVFVDGFDVDAVAAVTNLSRRTAIAIVEAFVVKSLVVRIQPHEPARFGLLETVKAYAEDRLVDAGEAAEVRDAHLEHFHRLAAVTAARCSAEIRLGVRLRPDRSNLTSAFEWGASQGDGSRSASSWSAATPPTCSTAPCRSSGRSSSERSNDANRTTASSPTTCAPCPSRPSRGSATTQRTSTSPASWRTSSVASTRIFAMTMRSYMETAADTDEARALHATARAELDSTPHAAGDRNLDIVAGMMAYIPAVLAAYDGDPAAALRHAEHALSVEASIGYRTVLLFSATQLAAACELVLGEPARARSSGSAASTGSTSRSSPVTRSEPSPTSRSANGTRRSESSGPTPSRR